MPGDAVVQPFPALDSEWPQQELRRYLMSNGWKESDFGPNERIPQAVKYIDFRPIDSSDHRSLGRMLLARKVLDTVDFGRCEASDPCAYDHTCRIHKIRGLLLGLQGSIKPTSPAAGLAETSTGSATGTQFQEGQKEQKR